MSEVREAIASATRIVVKVGSSSLTSEVGGVDEERLSAIVANVDLLYSYRGLSGERM